MQVLVLYVLIIILFSLPNFECEEEDDYYDEYYDDEIVVDPKNGEVSINSITASLNLPPLKESPPFQKKKVHFNYINMSELFLNITAEKYDCILRKNSFILAIEPEVETVVDQHELMKQHVSDLKQMIHKVQSQATAQAQKRSGFSFDKSKKKKSQQQQQQQQVQTKVEESKTDNATASSSSSNSSLISGDANDTQAVAKKKKKLTFRDKLNFTTTAKREKEKEREKIRPKFRLGADCESLLCTSCKVTVMEVTEFLKKAILANDHRIHEIADTDSDDSAIHTRGYAALLSNELISFCNSDYLVSNYKDILRGTCLLFENETLAVKDVLLSAFVNRETVEELSLRANLVSKMKHVCVTAGLCMSADFTFFSTAQVEKQEQWDDKCFVCQAAARDMEGYILLPKRVSARYIALIVAATCDRLQLSGRFDSLCRTMTSGKLLEDVSWFAKVHAESVMRKDKGELKFPDHLCEEIDWCQPWVDPEELKEREIRDNMEQVFF